MHYQCRFAALPLCRFAALCFIIEIILNVNVNVNGLFFIDA
jgi:hypothetical protein